MSIEILEKMYNRIITVNQKTIKGNNIHDFENKRLSIQGFIELSKIRNTDKYNQLILENIIVLLKWLDRQNNSGLYA